MIRYYTVSGDTKNGHDFEYIFRFCRDAEEKYNKIKDVPYKSLKATDDKKGEIIVMREG